MIRRAWLTRTLISIGCVAIVSLASALTVAETPRYLVGFVQDTLDNDWRVAQVDAVRTVLAEHPEIEFVVTDGGGDTAIQIQQIEEMAALGVDVLITSPREQALLTDVIADVYRQGIPVVLLDRGVQGERYTTYIHADNTRIAEDAAKHLVALLRGEGRILMLQGVPGATPTIHRTRHFLKIMSRYPKIEVKGVVANFLRSESILAVERLLQRGERFDAIYAQSDSMATGARLA